MADNSVPWYSEEAGFFGDEYLKQYGSLPSTLTNSEVEFVVRELGLRLGATVLDLACGHGRHAIQLAARGYRVTGLDNNSAFLREAQRRADGANVGVQWLQRDMRDIPYSEEFDAVACMFSSFGYLETDEENEKVLLAAARALKPGGRLLLDVRNRDRIIRNYREKWWDEFRDGTVVLCTTQFDTATGRSNETYRRLRCDGSSDLTRASVRLYTAPELIGMLRRCGLQDVRVFGDCDSSDFTFSSNRCLVVAEKPTRAPGAQS
ncbi:MAG: methyltransferase domain-containing protein [Polyangiaceae bacterium]|nr:methyltransferase domain-containing protein [Polyangiaceae bacterium]